MANLSVSYQDMTDAATRLTGGQDSMVGELTAMRAYVDGLVASGFVTDQASVAFGDSYRRYTQSLTDAVSALGGMAQYLRTSASALADVDSQLAAGLRG
ncbi:WXG100 family type VII secretion target [Cellulomonas marina]|uniref:WXG100 family type VII secretion target n=1 Tax=Cellulomonas marina TaxID=988821 RepID=A0A1I0ZJL1_9CELL|nr:WXG100 family type VII secretion target [Cellulomonas marina]GIG28545.1 hypothetical protein Cma02nite_11450 [Cellulomonas marina]SFB24588.1 WXG100 family type VII secretion target [Cellulomonas marina]